MSGGIQQELFKPRGGKRRGAGRKPTVPGKPRLRHAPREVMKARFPVHITMRVTAEIARLRNYDLAPVLRRAFVFGCVRGEFRICQFSIQGNHIHLICEASENTAISRGVQAWAIRVARGLNGKLGRRGRVFVDRYHMEILRSPKQTRAALCYVLQNARRHRERIDARFGGMDPFSSAWWFDGWREDSWRTNVPPPEMRTVAEAKTWLLNVGWRRHGLLAIDEVPAAARRGRNVANSAATIG